MARLLAGVRAVGVVSDAAAEERALAEAARGRDERAWSRLFDENFHSLYVYALCRVHDHSRR